MDKQNTWLEFSHLLLECVGKDTLQFTLQLTIIYLGLLITWDRKVWNESNLTLGEFTTCRSVILGKTRNTGSNPIETELIYNHKIKGQQIHIFTENVEKGQFDTAAHIFHFCKIYNLEKQIIKLIDQLSKVIYVEASLRNWLVYKLAS